MGLVEKDQVFRHLGEEMRFEWYWHISTESDFGLPETESRGTLRDTGMAGVYVQVRNAKKRWVRDVEVRGEKINTPMGMPLRRM